MKVLSGYEFQHHQRVEEVSTKMGVVSKRGGLNAGKVVTIIAEKER